MSIYATVGQLSYNGISFDGTANVTVSTEFIEDEAERTILYHQITLEVRTVFASDATTNLTMLDVRRKLGEQGRTLIFINQGFGSDLIVNRAGGAGLRDVKWGPKPRILSWEPIGSSQACEIEWEVTTCVPVCDVDGSPRVRGIMSINYQLDFSHDNRGYTTRTITGHLIVAQTRNGRAIPDVADNYWNALPATLPGFHREKSRSLSFDKSRLDFTIVDTEIPSPNAFPKGVVNITARHRVSWARRGGMAGWLRNVISVDMEVAADFSPSVMYSIFLAILRRRIAIAQAAPGTLGPHVLIEDISIDEDLFGRDASFTVSYRVTSKLSTILQSTGLWTPIGTDWTTWRLSMKESHSPLGHSGQKALASNDAIIDLCGGNTTIPWALPNVSLNQPQGRVSTQRVRNQKPSPANSFLGYDSKIETRRRRPVSRQSTLQVPDTDPSQFNPIEPRGIVYPQATGTPDVIQQGGQSRYEATLKGAAIRAGYEIPRPKLLTVGTATATEVDGMFSQSLIANWLGVPIYAAKWSINYDLNQSPGNVALLPNPKEV